jgi:anti-anti-sigma factor
VKDWNKVVEIPSVLKLDIQNTDEAAVVRCSGRVVHGYEAESLQRTVLSLQKKHIVIDLSQVEEIDAAGLGVLAVLQRWANDSNRTIRLLNPSQRLRQVLQLTGLDVVLDVSGQSSRAFPRSA